MQALLLARLDGDPVTGCLWLVPVHDPSTPGQPLSVVWPHGYTVETDPLRLVGPDGTVVARIGDVLQLAGGFSSGEADIDPRCQVSKSTAIVNEIEAVNPGP
jgi:hypothetical protein